MYWGSRRPWAAMGTRDTTLPIPIESLTQRDAKRHQHLISPVVSSPRLCPPLPPDDLPVPPSSRVKSFPTATKVASRSGPQAASQPEAHQRQDLAFAATAACHPASILFATTMFKQARTPCLMDPGQGYGVPKIALKTHRGCVAVAVWPSIPYPPVPWSHAQLSVPPYRLIVGADSYFTGTNQGLSYGAMVAILDPTLPLRKVPWDEDLVCQKEQKRREKRALSVSVQEYEMSQGIFRLASASRGEVKDAKNSGILGILGNIEVKCFDIQAAWYLKKDREKVYCGEIASTAVTLVGASTDLISFTLDAPLPLRARGDARTTMQLRNVAYQHNSVAGDEGSWMERITEGLMRAPLKVTAGLTVIHGQGLRDSSGRVIRIAAEHKGKDGRRADGRLGTNGGGSGRKATNHLMGSCAVMRTGLLSHSCHRSLKCLGKFHDRWQVRDARVPMYSLQVLAYFFFDP
ncbi:hypothetical protein B0H11DRAFT_1909336 [Mycena galericulata]|nr:hypothetical protein B0H11DRAFT_1909336 [Mycena galericulata]